MEFWGVEVKPGQSLKCNPGEEKYIHLSQAAIGEIKKVKNSQSIPLFVTFEGKKLVIGTLSPDSCLQISYDLVFEKEFELSHNWKDGSVYFTGYKTVIADEELEGYSDGDSDSEDLEASPLDNKANAAEKPEKPVAAAAKPKPEPSKAKTKPAEASVDQDEDEDDEDDDSSEDDESDEEMAEGQDDSESDEDEDDSSEEDIKATTPKKAEIGKKRASAGSVSKTATPEKKAKLVTPAGKTGAQDGKKGGHTATPYPNKQVAKTTAKPQTPKSAGSVSCKSRSKTCNSDAAFPSHTKAKHTK